MLLNSAEYAFWLACSTKRMQLMQDHRVKVLYHNGQTENIEMSIWPRGQLEIPCNNKSISFLSAYFKAPENLERTKQKKMLFKWNRINKKLNLEP